MFSEICHRLQTARPSNIKCLLYYLLPWLYNMELVDPNVCGLTDDDKNLSGAHGLSIIFENDLIAQLFRYHLVNKIPSNLTQKFWCQTCPGD